MVTKFITGCIVLLYNRFPRFHFAQNQLETRQLNFFLPSFGNTNFVFEY